MAALGYEISWGGVPMNLDFARCVRMAFPLPEQEDAESRPPRKYQPEIDISAEIDRLMSLQYLDEFAAQPQYAPLPSKFGSNYNALYPNVSPPVVFGDIYYPHGASSYGLFRMLASSSVVKAMIALGTGPQPLVLQADTAGASMGVGGGISTPMYLLPPRIISESRGPLDGLYILTFVDERYYFQGATASLTLTDASTWIDVVSQLATALGITATYLSTPPTAYTNSSPDPTFWGEADSAASLLDFAAFVTGTVIVRNLDGTYSLMNATDCTTRIAANRGANVVRTAGGEMFSADATLRAGDVSPTMSQYIPASVTSIFPTYLSNANSSSGTYPITFASTGTGSQGVYIPVQATITSAGGVPTNLTQLDAYSTRFGTDFVALLSAPAFDETYPGIVDWVPEGLHDILWTCSARRRQSLTRIIRNRSMPTLLSTQTGIGSGGGTTHDTYCSLAALQTTDCILVAGPSNSITLTYDSGSGTWTDTHTLSYPGGSGLVVVSYSAGSIHVTVGVFNGTYSVQKELLDCKTGCWQGGPLTGHVANGSIACGGTTFSICLSCIPCSGGIVTSCCPGRTLPNDLYLIAAGTGTDGTYHLIADPHSNSTWSFTGTVGSCPNTTLSVFCFSDSLTTTSWFLSSSTGEESVLCLSFTCFPTFAITFGNGSDSRQALSNLRLQLTADSNCGGNASGTWSVSTTNPGGGGGGTIATSCCPSNLLPATLHATITGGGGCSGTFLMSHFVSGGNDIWTGSFGTCTPAGVILQCASGTWSLQTTPGHVGISPTSVDCTIPMLVFNTAGPDCGCSAGFTITITA